MWFDASTGSEQAELTTNGINEVPFAVRKLFTRRLKSAIEKQGLRLAMGRRVAAMKRSVIEGLRCASTVPDFAALHPGYGLPTTGCFQ